MATLSSSRQKALLRKYARNLKFLMMLLSIAVIVFALPRQAKFSYEIEKGRIWNQKDLISPYNFAILKTNQETTEDKNAVLATITPIYQLQSNIGKQVTEGFNNDLQIKWNNANIDDRLKSHYLSVGNAIINDIVNTHSANCSSYLLGFGY